MRLLLILFVAFSCFSATVPGTDEWFRIEFRQDDKIIPVTDHTVKLKKDRFSILVSLKGGGSISVNASLDSVIYDMAREGRELQAFECFLPGTGMAEGLENKENDMSINPLAHNHWYYENEKAHRFNKVETDSGWVRGERVIKKIWVLENEISDPFKVSQFPSKNFFMVFVKSRTEGENLRELQRDYIRVVFEP